MRAGGPGDQAPPSTVTFTLFECTAPVDAYGPELQEPNGHDFYWKFDTDDAPGTYKFVVKGTDSELPGYEVYKTFLVVTGDMGDVPDTPMWVGDQTWSAGVNQTVDIMPQTLPTVPSSLTIETEPSAGDLEVIDDSGFPFFRYVTPATPGIYSFTYVAGEALYAPSEEAKMKVIVGDYPTIDLVVAGAYASWSRPHLRCPGAITASGSWTFRAACACGTRRVIESKAAFGSSRLRPESRPTFSSKESPPQAN